MIDQGTKKISQSALLEMTYNKVNELSSDIKEMKNKQEAHEVKIAVVETKVKMWAAIIGSAAALVVEFIINLTK